MASWIRNLVMLIAMAMWASYIIASLIRGTDIDTIVWGLPGAVYFALNPTIGRRGDDEKKDK